MLCGAFREKMIPVFGSEERTVEILNRYMNPERIVTAFSENRVIGVAGLSFGDSGFISIDLPDALREFKLKIFRTAFVGLILEGKRKKGSLLIESLAVEEKSRGKGTGTGILLYVLNYARMKKFENVRLYVSNKNERAFRLYERLGFKTIKNHKLPWPWRKIFGFELFREMLFRL